jgi:peroxiredoxin
MILFEAMRGYRYAIIFVIIVSVSHSNFREVRVILKVGQPAPDFTLPSQLGKDVSLSSLRGKTVVLAFFPLAWTPI